MGNGATRQGTMCKVYDKERVNVADLLEQNCGLIYVRSAEGTAKYIDMRHIANATQYERVASTPKLGRQMWTV